MPHARKQFGYYYLLANKPIIIHSISKSTKIRKEKTKICWLVSRVSFYAKSDWTFELFQSKLSSLKWVHFSSDTGMQFLFEENYEKYLKIVLISESKWKSTHKKLSK